jgi:AraC-like DNA-binding protein
MNVNPLCEYVARQLHTNVLLYHSNGKPKRQFSSENVPDFPSIFPKLKDYLLEQAPETHPMFSFINEYVCYSHFSYNGQTAVIGPFHMPFSENNAHARHIFFLEEMEQLKDKKTASFSGVSDVYPPYALRDILLLYNCLHTRTLTPDECFRKNFSTEYIREAATAQTVADIFSNRENQKMHNPYTQEVRLLKCIEDGDTQMLQKIWSEPSIGTLGTTAKDPVRNGKNMAIYTVTAAGRAAIRAGVSAEHIFSLTDSYAQQIENLKNMMLLQALVEDAQMNFAQMAADLKQSHNQGTPIEHPLVSRCKDYVFQHLHSTLTVKEIAKALLVHPNYLSSLFRSCEGETLYHYVLQQKINLTKNLLTYSEYSYLEIAHYLGFTSQSHLGTRFKSMTGMTLKQYRDTYQKSFPK